MYKTGSLFEAVQIRIDKGVKIGLLIIDEDLTNVPDEISNTPGHVYQYPELLMGEDPKALKGLIRKRGLVYVPESNVTTCQQRLLMYLQLRNCFVCSISYPLVFSFYREDPDMV